MSDGATGEMPWWYPVVSAARFLGVPPWDLVGHERGGWWMLVALQARKAEAYAASVRSEA